jgi:hypothetical protein
MLDTPVAEVVLDGAGSGALIRQGVSARMAKHVRVNLERETRSLPCALDDLPHVVFGDP